MKKTYLLLLALFFTLGANAQMVLEYEIPTSGDSIALPLSGTVDVTVDWGDGSQNAFESSGFKWHVFETAGTKTVTITGRLTHYGGYLHYGGNQYLTKVISWDGIGLTSLNAAFYEAQRIIQVPSTLPADVTDLSSMFKTALIFNQPIDNWNTENITDMSDMFYNAYLFNQPIGNWDTKNVIRMIGMFNNAKSFNQPIGNWNVENVIHMTNMFNNALMFNQPLGDWNTENVQSMNNMFALPIAFNQDISNWNTASVTDMNQMFAYNTTFNQPLESWNTSAVTNMGHMFIGAYNFNQPLGKWDISSVTNMLTMFTLTSLCTDNYDATLNGWASQTVQEGVELTAGNSKYSAAGEAARAKLTEKWTITDGGLGITEGNKCTTPVGLEAYSATRNVEIYPNPVSDKLYINATSLSNYAVYNLTGNLLEEAEGSEAEIDLSDLPSGIYILQTTSDLGISNQRFSKE